ncbi:MAG: ribosome maturation factor RimP [Thermodesulfovibrionales bacterium]|nr:ribosome maturation factor RimP [Thermodesulfovibrionales bacterium]
MKLDIIKQKIYTLASEVAEQEGLELYDVQILGSRKRTIVRVFIDKESGVTIDDCERVSKSLSALLDVEDPIKTSYTLEVSSPGIDRPLTKKKDYEKNLGKLVRIVTTEPFDNQSFFIGRIIDVGENWVRISYKKGSKEENLFIPFEKVSKAKLEIEF